MKKMLLVFTFLGMISFANADDHTSFKTEKVDKVYFACGTASSTLSGECWEATTTVTICSDDLGEAEATILASLEAAKTVRTFAPVLELLDEIAPC